MVRKGFKMKLYPGMEAEYEKRHNELWPEMQDIRKSRVFIEVAKSDTSTVAVAGDAGHQKESCF